MAIFAWFSIYRKDTHSGVSGKRCFAMYQFKTGRFSLLLLQEDRSCVERACRPPVIRNATLHHTLSHPHLLFILLFFEEEKELPLPSSHSISAHLTVTEKDQSPVQGREDKRGRPGVLATGDSKGVQVWRRGEASRQRFNGAIQPAREQVASNLPLCRPSSVLPTRASSRTFSQHWSSHSGETGSTASLQLQDAG